MFSQSLHRHNVIIPREQTYVTDKKLISIHSEDRDSKQWKNNNLFEIVLPEVLKNVNSLRLVNITIPDSIYTFTNNYQNTKLNFTVGSTTYTINIEEGTYTGEELANELTYKMNKGRGGNNFQVVFNKTNNKMMFFNTTEEFTLNNSDSIDYTYDCGYKNVFNQNIYWGLPYYLGFNKEDKEGQNVGSSYQIAYSNTTINTTGTNVYMCQSDNICVLQLQDSIYIELDKYNNISEIEPYSTRTNNSFNNDYNASVNSAFAKILLTNGRFENIVNDITHLPYCYVFKTPNVSIDKLKFKLRFHDGRLVDLKNQPFSMLIEAETLVDEQQRNMSIRYA